MKRWRESFPIRQAGARPLAAFSVCILIGMLLERRLRPASNLCLALCLFAAIVLAGCIIGRRRMLAAALLLGACFGMLRMAVALEAYPVMATRYSVRMVGRVDSEPWIKPETGRLIFRYRLKSVDDAPEETVVRLYLRGEAEALAAIEYGQTLAVTGHIWQNDPVTNPYEFDFAEWLHRNGMAAIATAKIEQVEIISEQRDVRSLIIGVRRIIGTRIDELFPESAPLARALVLGDRSMIGEELRESLNATGTAHLIAISGLHVTVLAMAMALLMGLFLPRRWANLLTLVPLLLYGALIGFNAPFVRAVIMFAIFSFGPIAGMPSDPVTRLCAAMLVWLTVHPLSLADAGFVLSFSASAGILLLMPPLMRLFRIDRLTKARVQWHSWRRAPRQLAIYLGSLLCASLAAQLATLPAVTALFGAQSVVSLPFNLVCVPLCMAGYVLTAISLAISGLLLPAGRMLARPADALLALLMRLPRLSRALPVTAIHIGRYPTLLIFAHGVVALAASELSAIKPNRRRYISMTLVGVAGLTALWHLMGAMPFSVTVLDAGQANCAILTTSGRTYVFDAGDTYTPAADYLNATCLHLNGVFLSHPHEDHAGGLFDLLTTFRPDAIYVPAGWFECTNIAKSIASAVEQARALEIPIVELRAGETLSLSPEAALTVYNPSGDAVPDEVNDLSMVLGVESGGHAALFTGDLTMNGEPTMLPDCDVLHVPHHGADNAASAAMLKAVSPEYAVISVGENNYGHPGDEALSRLEDSGAEVLRTDVSGAITLTLCGDEWRVSTFLEASDAVE